MTSTLNEPQRPLAITASLARKVAVTVVGIAVCRVCLQITMPGVDSGILAEFFGGSLQTGQTSGLHVISVRFGFLSSLSSHSIGQYLGASYLLLLLSGVVPWLKRLRDGGLAPQVSFDRIIIALAVILMGWQGWQKARWLESIQGPNTGLSLVSDPGWGFRLLAVTTVVGGTALVIWIAHVITERGIGNGVAVIVGADILAELPGLASQEYQRLVAGVTEPRYTLYGAVALVLLLALAIAMVSAARQIPLKRRDRVSDDSVATPNRGRPLALPLRVQAVGLTPVLAAQSLMFMAQTALVAWGGLALASGQPLVVGSSGYWQHWVINAALIILLTYLFAFITFSSRDAVARIGRYGYCVAGTATEGEAVALIRDTHLRIVLCGGLYLGVVAAMPAVLEHVIGAGSELSRLCGTQMLILAAVSVDIIRQVRAELAMQASCAQDGGSSPWIPVLTAQTRLETEMAQALLADRGIQSVPMANRVTCATGTLAFWEASRPRFPCLTIHRRLGGGQATLMVPPQEADQARQALEELGIASA